MTEKIFYDNPYLFEYEGIVKRIIRLENETQILLQATIFYPEGGGQPSDMGFIENTKIKHVYEKDEEVIHVCDGECGLSPGDRVKLKIDEKRRIRYMRNHTGQHILSSVFQSMYGFECTGLHMGEEYTTIDIKVAEMQKAMIDNAEVAINDMICENLEVKTYFVNQEELERYPLRKKVEKDGPLRIVQIGYVEYVTCCGAHVGRTGDVGVLKIVKFEKYKGMTRLYFKCGKDALLDYQKKHDIVKSASFILSSGDENLISRIEGQKTELEKMQKELNNIKAVMMSYRAEEILSENTQDVLRVEFDNLDFKDMDRLSKEILKRASKVLIFLSVSENKIILAAGEKSGVHCGNIFKEEIKGFDGKGGGGPKFAQARFENALDMKAFCDYLYEKLK